MAHYAVGDVQGCYAELAALLDLIGFNHGTDTLWLAGDLVNRGADSLSCLQFAMRYENSVQMVLGNHDLHLLAVSYGLAQTKRGDTLDAVLKHPKLHTMRDWLRTRPLLRHNDSHLLVHAGILPEWTAETAVGLAAEVSSELGGRHPKRFLSQMYGNHPSLWSPVLAGSDRLRFAVNVFTRMRVLDHRGALDFHFKSTYAEMPDGLHAWFDSPRRQPLRQTIVFGHWSALGYLSGKGVISLDTGAVWGGMLTAVRLDDGAVWQQPALHHTHRS